MTRQDIEHEYIVEDGRILSPGKFAGENVYVPYFYDAYMNGCADEDDGEVLSFHVLPTDRAMFPELGNTEIVQLQITNDGFVIEL